MVQLGLEPGGYVLIVARLVPENNVAMMLEAANEPGSQPSWSDPVDRISSSSSRRTQPAPGDGTGHVSDQDLLSALWAHCGVYLHGHSVGGTNPALVQAMGLGAPVLAVDTPFNREVVVLDDLLVPLRPTSLLSGRICCFDRSSCGPPPQSAAGPGRHGIQLGRGLAGYESVPPTLARTDG